MIRWIDLKKKEEQEGWEEGIRGKGKSIHKRQEQRREDKKKKTMCTHITCKNQVKKKEKVSPNTL
jgi:hypothetical protein